MSLPDPAPVLDLIEAFRRSKTMFTAVSLGIFDLLGEVPASAAQLAGRTGTDAGALERLLDGCAALGVLRKTEGLYSNTPAAACYLQRDSPETLAGYVLYSDQALFPMWAHLEDALREGRPRWKQVFGADGPIFNAFFRTPEAMRTFIRGMHGLGLMGSPEVVGAFDLSGFRRLVDLGGGTGHLVMTACEKYPELAGAVFDLPAVIDLAREELAASPARDRIELIAGDFFQDRLPPADLYALGRILHDWTEEKIVLLLTRIRESLPPRGGLLVAEMLLNEDGVGPVPANMQSLNMLVVTEGRERTASDYTRLLNQAGFADVRARRTGSALDAILALKN